MGEGKPAPDLTGLSGGLGFSAFPDLGSLPVSGGVGGVGGVGGGFGGFSLVETHVETSAMDSVAVSVWQSLCGGISASLDKDMAAIVAQAACKNCAAGTYNDLTAQDAASDCKACVTGKYSE